MSKSWNYNEDKTRIVIEPPKQHKKVTGHRCAGILGLDPYTDAFKCWCEITKLAEPPFEDTKYTIFGKTVEPQLIEYAGKHLPNVVSIADYYGDVFDEYRYDNFKYDSKIGGGVIDAVTTLNDGKTITSIIECKTSSHPEQWANNNVPVQYALQGALYAYLKKVDTVVFVCTFPTDLDYGHPDRYLVADSNTIFRVVKLKDLVFEVEGELLNIEGCMEYIRKWWDGHIVTGISPEFDEKLDKEYLDIIRATDVTKDTPLEDACKESFKLAREIKELKESTGINEMEKRLKSLESSIKQEMIDTAVDKCGGYVLRKSTKTKFAEDAMADEHPDIYEKYIETTITYTLTKEKIENE